MELHSFRTENTRHDYFKYPDYPFSTDTGNNLDLFTEIFTCDESFIKLLPYTNQDEWFTLFYGSINDINTFARLFLRKYRNYKMNFYPYVNYKYLIGNREYNYTDDFSNWWKEMYNNMAFDIVDLINNNRRKYERYYNVITKEYEPLWNVDGTETRTLSHEGENADTIQRSSTSNGSISTTFTDFLKTNTKSLSDTLEKAGIETDTRTLDTVLTYAGMEENILSGDEKHDNYVTTFNSDTHYDSSGEKISFDNRKDTKQFTNRTDSNTGTDTLDKTFDNRIDTHTLSETDTESQTGSKTDTQTNSSLGTDTSSGSNSYEDTENTTRQGNIGVTSSQNLFNQELELVSKLVIYDSMAYDIASEFLILNKGV